MKSGVRALGIAESFRGREGPSTLCGAVIGANRVIDGFCFGSCTIGGVDVTRSLTDLVTRLDREDVQYVLISGLALAWYNVVDLEALGERTDRPVCSVTFEESAGGLEAGLRDAFSGTALSDRLDTYRRQPPRQSLRVDGETLFVRSVGLPEKEAGKVVKAFTPEGGRPEPLRVARLAARAADQWPQEE